MVPGGTASATTDRARIRGWWAHWPQAGIGLVTGRRSGLAVLDIDPAHDGLESLRSLADSGHGLPTTLCANTGGGGRHYFFAISAGERVANTSGRVPGVGETPGVDIRGDGGYVVAAPSLHRSGQRYAWRAPTAELAALPSWMRKPPPRRTRPAVPVPSGASANRYTAAVLRREADAVAGAPEGRRSDQLNRSAFALGTLVGASSLAQADVEASLLAAALQAGLGHTEATRTISSGLRAGMARPREVTP